MLSGFKMAKARKEIKTLDSGKTVISIYGEDGRLTCEDHVYRSANSLVAISYFFEGDSLLAETYFVGSKKASKKKYEEERVKYADMPPAGVRANELENLKPLLRQERESWIEEFNSHVKDSRAAILMDEEREISINSKSSILLADSIVRNIKLRLDEKLLSAKHVSDRLGKYGIGEAWIISAVDTEGDFQEIDCEGVIVRLPSDRDLRRKFFLMNDRLARKDGFSGAMDDGQTYEYMIRIP